MKRLRDGPEEPVVVEVLKKCIRSMVRVRVGELLLGVFMNTGEKQEALWWFTSHLKKKTQRQKCA